jgi:hypothetical protein
MGVGIHKVSGHDMFRLVESPPSIGYLITGTHGVFWGGPSHLAQFSEYAAVPGFRVLVGGGTILSPWGTVQY